MNNPITEVLSPNERNYLKSVFKPYNDRINCVIKKPIKNAEYIIALFKDCNCFIFPYFDKDTMYQGMVLNKEYSLEELGLK